MNIDHCSASLPELSGPPKDNSTNMIWSVPRIVNNLFTGRTGIIAKVMNAISNSRRMTQQHRFIIGGMERAKSVCKLQTRYEKST